MRPAIFCAVGLCQPRLTARVRTAIVLPLPLNLGPPAPVMSEQAIFSAYCFLVSPVSSTPRLPRKYQSYVACR